MVIIRQRCRRRHTERDIELIYERKFLDLCAERFESRRVGVNDGNLWRFILDESSGVDIEHWNYNNRQMGDHTKMSLARQLQSRDGLSDDARNRIYSLSRAALLAMIRAGPGVDPAAALAAHPPPAGGRGGRGRGAVAGRAAGRRGRGRGAKGGRG